MPRLRAIASGLLFLLAIAAGSLLLDRLARAQLRAHLTDTATQTLATRMHGDSPARWALTAPADIVTGVAIGPVQSRFDDDGLHVRSSGGPFEVGLVVPIPIDLDRHPILELAIDARIGASLSLAVRHTLDAPLCTSAALPLAQHGQTMLIDLHSLAWQCDDGSDRRPGHAAMLRLRVEVPAHARAVVRLADVRLLPRGAFDPASLDVLQLDVPTDDMALAVLRHVSSSRWPVVELDLRHRVEPTLQAIDRIRVAAPAALIVPQGRFTHVLAEARARAPAPPGGSRAAMRVDWALVALLAIALAWIRLRSWTSARWQAIAELAGVIVVPLVLVASGAIGDDIAVPTLVAIVLCIVFAASLLKGNAPRQPGTSAWLAGAAVAVASIALTVVVVAVLHDPARPWHLPSPTDLLRYLGWAAVQQFLVTVIIAGCIERTTASPRIAMLLAAFVFALLHAPNAMLMQFTFLGGLIWTWNWQRHRAVLANTFAHATSGLLLTAGLPPEWLRSAEIGARYFLF